MNDLPQDQNVWLSPNDNQALAMQEFKSGVLEVRSTPRMITLETSSRCNLRCVMCPHAINAVQRPRHLDVEIVQRLGRFIHQSSSLQLHGIGEPLASPGFWQTLDFIPIPEVCDSSINTNLTVLDEKRLARLHNSNLKIINVSLDAATTETYQKIRGFDFSVVLNNLQRLIEMKRQSQRRFPLLYLNMTLMRSNIEEAVAFVRLAKRVEADLVCFWHLNRWNDEEMARYIVQRDDWTFDYQQEGLWNHPALSNRCIREAMREAEEIGVKIYLDHNKSVFFDETNSGEDTDGNR